MMLLRPEQSNLRCVFRLSYMLSKPLIRLNSLKLSFPWPDLNPIIDSIYMQVYNVKITSYTFQSDL